MEEVILEGKKITIKKGALKQQLGYRPKETIPLPVLRKIKRSEVGDIIVVRGRKKKVTKLMKKRVNLALVLIRGSKKS